jgi:hypothetical protein
MFTALNLHILLGYPQHRIGLSTGYLNAVMVYLLPTFILSPAISPSCRIKESSKQVEFAKTISKSIDDKKR